MVNHYAFRQSDSKIKTDGIWIMTEISVDEKKHLIKLIKDRGDAGASSSRFKFS